MLDDLKKYFDEFLGPVLGWASYVITIVTLLIFTGVGLHSGRIDPKFLACFIPFLVWIGLVTFKNGVIPVGLFFLFCALVSATLLSVLRFRLISYEAIQFAFVTLAMLYFSLKSPSAIAQSESSEPLNSEYVPPVTSSPHLLSVRAERT